MNKKGFTLSGLIGIITIIGFIIAGIILVIKLTRADKTYKDLNDEAVKTAQKRRAEMIISGIELSYATAIMSTPTNVPSLDNIRNVFNVNNSKVATWTDDIISTDLDFNCEVDLTSNTLHVNCLGIETQKNMPFTK